MNTTKTTAKPRTCCPTHSDLCRFGRWHMWHGPFLLDEQRLEDGPKWSHRDDVKCGTCDAVCTANRESA